MTVFEYIPKVTISIFIVVKWQTSQELTIEWKVKLLNFAGALMVQEC